MTKQKRFKILDVGGNYKTYPNATHIIDIRKPLKDCKLKYTQMNICEKTWPFEDDEFDFVFCGNTIEDLKNPLFVCKEMMRVGKAGRIVVPDILTECTKGVDSWMLNETYAGFYHHRWLIAISEGKIELIPKTPIVSIFDWTGHISKEEKKKHFYAIFDWKDDFEVEEWIMSDWNMVYELLSKCFGIDPLGRYADKGMLKIFKNKEG